MKDLSVYKWKNIDGRQFTGTREELVSKYGLCKRGLRRLVNGHTKNHKGWQIAGIHRKPMEIKPANKTNLRLNPIFEYLEGRKNQ